MYFFSAGRLNRSGSTMSPAGHKAGLVAAVAVFVSIVVPFLGLGSRVLFRVSTRSVPIPVDNREWDRVGLGLSRLAPVALLAVLAVNRVDERRFGAANPPRHGCVHFSSPLVCVNKGKEPPRAAVPSGVANIVGFSCRSAEFMRGRMGYSIWQGV